MNDPQDQFSDKPLPDNASQGGDWQTRFPDMTPVHRRPPLSTINGIGLMVYGRRDYDHETGTYVKTLCFALLFMPVLCVKAYRVADASPGWYFLGTVPLSAFAKAWNLFVLALITFGGGTAWWVHHTGTPEYQAGKLVAEGDALADDGKLADAAQRYRTVALGPTAQAAAARNQLGALLDNPAAQKLPNDAVKVIGVAADVHKSGRTIDRLFERGVALAQKYAESDPRVALKLVDGVAFLAPPKEDLSAFRAPLLERLAAKDPDDIEVLSERALIYETKQDYAACEKLLAPHAARLGDKEGARILGQIYARQGKIAEAYDLLQPYTEDHLKRWNNVENTQKEAVKQADAEAMQQLHSQHAPGFDYARHKSADQATQARMVQDYLDSHLKDHPAFRKAMEDLRKESRVVPVALDFGIVLLRRAQGMNEPDKRRQELERAEKTFLAIRTAAEKSEEYRLFLGQVYYWLGRHAEGRKLFDELVHFEGGRTLTKLAVANALREVGDVAEARKLAEEAYEKEADIRLKQGVAGTRALLYLDLDDRITWLKRGNLSDPNTKADLSAALGEQAFRKGQDQEASQHYREAVRIYESMPESPASLNNSALAYYGLYAGTRDPAALDKAIANQEKALALRPGDSIVLRNVAASIQANALRGIIGKSIDLTLLRRSGSIELLYYLWSDDKTREHYRELVRSDAGIAKARTHFERLRVLAPKSTSAYDALSRLHVQTRDLAALGDLHRHLQEAALDLADYRRRTFDNLKGKEDEKLRVDLASALARVQEQLQAARKVGGPTLAVAINDLASIKIAFDWLGDPVDASEVVTLAEEACQAAPSRGSEGLQQNAWLLRAHQTLRKQQQAYAKLADQARRSLGYTDLIAIALSPESPVQKACQANADVQRTFNLIRRQFKSFPEDSDEWDWAMLRSTSPDEAARIAERLKGNELRHLERAIAFRMAPLSAHEAYRQHWLHLIDGDRQKASAVLREVAKQGIPIPQTDGR
jgi:hypothetical protein